MPPELSQEALDGIGVSYYQKIRVSYYGSPISEYISATCAGVKERDLEARRGFRRGLVRSHLRNLAQAERGKRSGK